MFSNTKNKVLAAILTVGGMTAVAAPADASMLLSYQETSSGLSGTGSPTVFPSNGGTGFYGDSFNAPTQTISSSPSPGYGFYDYFYFTVPNAVTADSITSTISLGQSSMISNMEVILYNATNNTPPVRGIPAGSVVAESTPITIGPGMTGQIEVLDTEITQPGTYVLQVRGTAIGANGGSYSGSLNVNPVPLPAALPLLLSGFGLLGGLFRRR
jgi:hypothetical protein